MRTSKPSLESLESRLAPAAVVKSGLTLSVSAQSGPLTVEAVPGGIRVKDSATNQVVAGVVARVVVTDTPASDAITVRGVLAPLTACLTVNAGRNPAGPGETDVVAFQGVGVGSHNFNGGYGSLMVLYELADVAVYGDVTFRGAAGGHDFVSLQSGPSNRVAIHGDLTVHAGANTGASVASTNLTIIGQSDWSRPAGVTVSGRVKYDGGPGVDVVQFHDVRLGCVDVRLGGNPANVFIDSPSVFYRRLSVTGDGGIFVFGTVI